MESAGGFQDTEGVEWPKRPSYPDYPERIRKGRGATTLGISLRESVAVDGQTG